MGTESVRWAMIGAGAMSASIAGDFGLTENAELAVVMARRLDKAQAFASEWNIASAVDSFDAVWSNDTIDAVYIATPHPSHFALSKAALEAGKHVLVEKPMTMLAAEARELGRLAASAGLFLMEAMWMLFNPTIRRIIELAETGAIGDIRSVQAGFGIPIPYDPESRLWKPDLGASSTLDQGVYPISLAYALLGRPDAIHAHGSVTAEGVDTEASILFEYFDGRQALLNTSMVALLQMSASVSGRGGRIEVDAPFWFASGYSTVGLDYRSTHVDVVTEGQGYVPMLRAASQAILDGERQVPIRPIADTVAVMEIVEEVLRQLAGKSH